MTTGSDQKKKETPLFGGGNQILLVEIAPKIIESIPKLAGNTFVFTRFKTLDTAVLARIAPDVVLAPLLGQGFDIMDVVECLEELGFSGTLYAVTSPLPNSAAVLAELRTHGLKLRIEILEHP